MNIVIGETFRTGPAVRDSADGEQLSLEASLLEIRDQRQTSNTGASRGRIITLLIPDGQKIPRGVESGNHRIYLRFVPRRQART